MTPQVEYAINRLRMYREMRGLTIEQLGMGNTKSYWSDFENMRNEPRMSTIVRYCDALGVNLDTILWGCPNSTGESRVPARESLAAEAKNLGWKSVELDDERLWLAICVAKDNPEVAFNPCDGTMSSPGDAVVHRNAALRLLGIAKPSGYACTIGKTCFLSDSKGGLGEDVKPAKVSDFSKYVQSSTASNFVINGRSFTKKTLLGTLAIAFE